MEHVYGERFTRALSYKTITRFEFQDLSKHQNENSAVENDFNVLMCFDNDVFQSNFIAGILPQSVLRNHPSTYGWTLPICGMQAKF